MWVFCVLDCFCLCLYESVSVWGCMLLLACVCFLGIRKGLGQSEERAQGRKKKRERVGVRRGWNNKGWWKMTSLVKEVFLKAPHLTQAAMPYRQDCPPPLPLTHRVPGCTGRADSLKPLTAAPWVGSCVFTFTCRLRGLILKPMIAPMCHNWQQNENTLTGLHDHLAARWG